MRGCTWSCEQKSMLSPLSRLSLKFILCVWVFCLHVCMCTICEQCQWEPKEGTGSPGTGVRDNCKLPYECWELNTVLFKSGQCSELLSHHCTST
ncbi:hypothetical protein I79_018812 [Cricetulus griseus]|uniref:Uncharacterized protein n=1 Tax=Cricetulus griseus TaxID=10029 RepID=G3I5Q7_CRIGR|nr:hypothetical protein I79_018812 [Cricetulus griseus]